ncbi:hypothetical protein EON63_12155, partial [archaeon]
MERYVYIMDNHLQESNALKRRHMMGLSHLDASSSSSAAEARAERDTWGLLQILSESDVLGVLNYDECAANLEKALSELPIGASTLDHIHTASTVDNRLKKLHALARWLELAALDDVVAIPVSVHEPWADTLHMLKLKKSTAVCSIHPDAQVTKDGRLLPLSGIDKADQETLYKYTLQLLRAGQQQRAREVAEEHRVFWLAATLSGVST